MKVVFISNYLTHHQEPFCNAMYSKLGKDFCFVETIAMEDERVHMGWKSNTPPYIISAWKAIASEKRAEDCLAESDIIVIGACSDEWYQRVKQSKAAIVFLYSERIFKKGAYQSIGPGAKRYKRKIEDLMNYKNTYMLSASAFLPYDLSHIGLLKDKCLKWGYFPPAKEYEDINKLIGWKHPASILWAGRLIGWKHPEDAIYTAEKLIQNGYEFTLDIIGDGELRPKLEKMIADKRLDDFVHILGFMPQEDVREHMEKADIYLFTSDRHEGWGAVLNESMNSACAVVANKEIGSVPYLIEDGVNGLIYDRRKRRSLYNKVSKLLDDSDFKKQIQKNAFSTITNQWNGEVAAARLLEVSENILSGAMKFSDNGPCSVAEVLRG